MTNPWLDVPAEDYEGHMASPEVGQLQVLNDLCAQFLAEFSPASLAVFGCATGNGFEHIDPAITKRVVGVDINAAFLRLLETRYAAGLPSLGLIEADFSSPSFEMRPVSAIMAALVYEFVDLDRALRKTRASLIPGGTLMVVLQLANSGARKVTPTAYTRLAPLASVMTPIDPDEFTAACERENLLPIRGETIPLRQGKSFFVGLYRREA